MTKIISLSLVPYKKYPGQKACQVIWQDGEVRRSTRFVRCADPYYHCQPSLGRSRLFFEKISGKKLPKHLFQEILFQMHDLFDQNMQRMDRKKEAKKSARVDKRRPYQPKLF